MNLLKALKQVTLHSAKTTGVFALARNSHWRQQRLLILGYHGISIDDEHEWNPELFLRKSTLRERFQTIKTGGYSVLPLEEAIHRLYLGTLPAKAVALTFDDGTHDFVLHALPLLQEYDFPATVYVTTYYAEHALPVFDVTCSYILWKGRHVPLDCGDLINLSSVLHLNNSSNRARAQALLVDFAVKHELSATAKHELLARLARQLDVDFNAMLAKRLLHIMTPTEVARAAAAGVDVQLHTHRHRAPDERGLFLREIEDNRRVIERCSGRFPVHFCYPSGVHKPEFLPWLQEAHIATATTCHPALATRETNALLLPRLIDTSCLSPIEFESWLAGLSQLLPQRSRS